MRTDTADRIIKFIEQNEVASPKMILENLGISQVAVHKQLKKLLATGRLTKLGQPPQVFYRVTGVPMITAKNAVISRIMPNESTQVSTISELNPNLYLDYNDYLYITPAGKLYYGMAGFEQYCLNNKLPFLKTLREYFEIKKKYDQLRGANGLIEATQKLKTSFTENFINKLFYLDFYSYERFGKTFLAHLTFQAKQSQDKSLIRRIAEIIHDQIQYLIKTQKIDAVAFVPPTVDRKVQFQKELANCLELGLPHITIIKIFENTPVQQKTLKKISDRIENAQKTFVITDRRQFQNVLLIDDFVGSGASLNELAKKLKARSVCLKSVIAVGLTGSLKGFEVVNQV